MRCRSAFRPKLGYGKMQVSSKDFTISSTFLKIFWSDFKIRNIISRSDLWHGASSMREPCIYSLVLTTHSLIANVGIKLLKDLPCTVTELLYFLDGQLAVSCG